MSFASGVRLLHQLARLYGVQIAYYDVFHRRIQASVESLLAVLQSLGAPVVNLQDVPSAWRERRQALWQRRLDPVIVDWDGTPLRVHVRLPSNNAEAALSCHLELETGEQQNWEWTGADLPVIEAVEIEGTQYVVKQLPLPSRLPRGYHRLTLEIAGEHDKALIISAPPRAYNSREGQKDRRWGVFLPLYALHTEKSWGAGDFSDLEALIAWVSSTGGSVVATLPLLTTFYDGASEPSPYLPVSRLLWNEFYLDINSIPELQRCLSVQSLLESSLYQKEIGAIRHSLSVDYPQQMALKRRILEELCRCLFSERSERLQTLLRFAKANPLVEDYARFRATCEKQRTSWQYWPQPQREGLVREGDYDGENRYYHLYVQWLAHQQIEVLSEKARGKGLQLYLDLPLGVHPDGYDVWRERNLFAANTSAGAPPDSVFTRGQNWIFPPMHPDKMREQGYRYTVAYLRHHLRYAGILRVDHVMGLHRLFWIPEGLEVSQGVYVRYRAEELYAILAVESHRSGTIIVGEDLGTVSPEVRPAMARYGLHRMYVLQYELASNEQKVLRPVSANCVASLNTHDMSPFTAYWQGLDIEDRIERGLLKKAGARAERGTRQATKKALVTSLQDKGWLKKRTNHVGTVLRACLAFLSASPARVVLVNLEDLWAETRPQNVPGTVNERPNWQRKASHSFETFCQMPQVLGTLLAINKLRKQDKGQ